LKSGRKDKRIHRTETIIIKNNIVYDNCCYRNRTYWRFAYDRPVKKEFCRPYYRG
jgi:hypothetical protein